MPALGDGADLPAAAERRLGDRIASSIYRDPDYLDDAVLGDYLQSLWQPLMNAARQRGELSAELDDRFAWRLFLVRNRSVNAFALPGGYLGVHTGLVAVVNTPAELAAVLAHELSHVTQRHISRLMTQQQRQSPWLMAAMILGVMAASKNPDAAGAAIVGGQAVAAQGQLNFSRDMEREADRVGFGVMTDAGFDSRGVGGMFEKLQQAARLNDNGSFPYLRSHPLTTERLAEARARVQMGVPPAAPGLAAALPSATLHAMMAGRARVLGEPGVDDLRAMVAQARQPLPQASAHQRLSALYAGTLSAGRLRDPKTANTLIAQLEASVSADAAALQAVRLLRIELAQLAGQTAQAAAATEFATAQTRADVLVQGQALVSAGRAAEVMEKLQLWVASHPKDAAAWHLLSSANGQQNRALQAVRADAEGRVAELDYNAALDRLKAAQALLRNGPQDGSVAGRHIEASIIDTRTRQLQSMVREQAVEDKLDR